MCSVIVYFLHCICVCNCDGRHKSLIMLSHSVMVRRSHLLARYYLGTMCMCTTRLFLFGSLFSMGGGSAKLRFGVFFCIFCG
jgi:hypothetical protein